jgi:hypothetical protein
MFIRQVGSYAIALCCQQRLLISRVTDIWARPARLGKAQFGGGGGGGATGKKYFFLPLFKNKFTFRVVFVFFFRFCLCWGGCVWWC